MVLAVLKSSYSHECSVVDKCGSKFTLITYVTVIRHVQATQVILDQRVSKVPQVDSAIQEQLVLPVYK